MKKCLFLFVFAFCLLLFCCPSSKAASNTDLENQIKILSQKGALPSNAYENYMASPYKVNLTNNNYFLFITGSADYLYPNKFIVATFKNTSTYIWEYNNQWRTDIGRNSF